MAYCLTNNNKSSHIVKKNFYVSANFLFYLFCNAVNVTFPKINPVYYKGTEIDKNTYCTKTNPNQESAKSPLSEISVLKSAEIALQQEQEKNFFKEFINQKSKVTKEEYEDILKNHPAILLKAQKYCADKYDGESTPETVADITLRVDKYFKRRFKNHRIISIGTSPSPVTEQLACMGHDVVFLPVTGLRTGYIPTLTKLENRDELRALMQYLDAKNIDDGKLNVVFDYTSSKITLDIITSFIREYFDFKFGYLTKHSINENILAGYCDKARNDFMTDLVKSNVGKISNVPHFPVTQRGISIYSLPGHEENMIFFDKNESKQELFEKFDNSSTPLGRAFALCTMHEINKLLS